MLSRTLREAAAFSRLNVKQDDLAPLVGQVAAGILLVIDPAGETDRRRSILLGLLAFGILGINDGGKGNLAAIRRPGWLADTARIARQQAWIATTKRQQV